MNKTEINMNLGNLFDTIQYDHVWIYTEGVLEEGEDVKTLDFYLKHLCKPILNYFVSRRINTFGQNADNVYCGTLNRRLKIGSLSVKM